MKVLVSLFGGAVQLQENAGVVCLVFDDKVGGGAAAGIISGCGKIQINAMAGIQLGEAMLNKSLPASAQPLASVIEGIVNQALRAIE